MANQSESSKNELALKTVTRVKGFEPPPTLNVKIITKARVLRWCCNDTEKHKLKGRRYNGCG